MKNVEIKKLGRPVNVNSARQQRIAELAEKKANGTLKKGRPVKEGSMRQINLTLKALKMLAGEEIKKGRPVKADSARQQRIAELAAKAAANGGTVKRGRPAKAKVDIESIELVELTAANGGIE
jgi:hypothetical protein